MSIQLKRSLSSNIDKNYVLAQGQVGIEMPTDSNLPAPFSFKMKIGDGKTSWKELPYSGDALYAPLTREINGYSLDENITLEASDVGALAEYGNAVSATKLVTSRSIQINLASTSAATFNGLADVTPGVTGVLPVANGGTGATTLDALKQSFNIPIGIENGVVLQSGVADVTRGGTFGNDVTGMTNIKYITTSLHCLVPSTGTSKTGHAIIMKPLWQGFEDHSSIDNSPALGNAHIMRLSDNQDMNPGHSLPNSFYNGWFVTYITGYTSDDLAKNYYLRISCSLKSPSLSSYTSTYLNLQFKRIVID